MLAWLTGEPGAEVVEPLLDGAFITSVNLSEVVSKAAQHGIAEPADVAASLCGLGVTVVDFTFEDAVAVGDLVERAKPLGLSLGDRACLAVAIRLEARVVTADRRWKEFEGFDILLIR